MSDSRLFPNLLFVLTDSLPEFAIFKGGAATISDGLDTLYHHAAITIIRVMIGVWLGLVVSVIIFCFASYHKVLRRQISGILALLRPVPMFALIPLFMFWFGDREFGVVIYVSFGVFVIIATSLIGALENVNEQLLSLSMLFGATKTQQMKYVTFFSALPQLLGSTKVAMGWSWALSLGAEIVQGKNGLGYLTYQSFLFSDMGKLFLLALVYIMLSLISNTLLTWLECKTISWI